MITVLLGALSLAGLSRAAAVPAAVASDPPIRITLNSDGYYDRGDRAKVRLRVADDGYVIVLRADADGRVRVLYPLDPGDDNFVRGGHDFELRGRGDRETFYVDDASGTGEVLGAWSARPFHFERYVRGDHWDYRVLASDQTKDDAEAGLLDLVTDMASGEHFEYDVARYSVGEDNDRSYRTHSYSTSYFYDPFYYDSWYDPWYYGSGLHIGIGFGYPYRYRPWYYDPFFYDPFYYDPFYYSSYYRYGYYRPYGFSSFCWSNPYCYGYGYGYRTARPGGGFAFKPRQVPPLVLPRQRTPYGTALGVSRREPQGGRTGWMNNGDPLGGLTRRRGGDTPRFDPMRPVDRGRDDVVKRDRGGAIERNRDGGYERGGDRAIERDRNRDDRPSRDARPDAGSRRRDEPSRGANRGRDDRPSRDARPSNDRGSSNSGRSSGGGGGGYRSSGGGGGGGRSSPPARSSGGGGRSSGGGSRPSNSSGGRRGH